MNYFKAQRDKDIDLAKSILNGKAAGLEELLDLFKHLKRYRCFGYARKIIALAHNSPEFKQLELDRCLYLAQQQALCTYKDPDLPVDYRLDWALEILEKVENLSTTKNQETLGLAGAIFKRKWEAHNEKQYLERSLAYYLRGHLEGIATSNKGYDGINAAFVMDLLANLESTEAKKAGFESEIANHRLHQAEQIRREIANILTHFIEQPGNEGLKDGWWVIATIAEAYFGLGEYEEAGKWLEKAAASRDDVQTWQRETRARQLITLARLHSEGLGPDAEGLPAWQALYKFLGKDSHAINSAIIGKVGLALSGGGFRASLFHIGVLAKLAELDWLRHIEVLSCVSGGSIVGAYYYLEVRELLKRKRDDEITREDYIEIVKRMERNFLSGVQENIRVRVISNLWFNIKMLNLNASRCVRVGKLYEKKLYARINDGEGKKPRYLNELFIKPEGEEDFEPKNDNWCRSAKVPILILNATTLNTGHNWQFTASWMGEPPTNIKSGIDGNDRLRRMYYKDAPDRYKKFRLGEAVAASACVPGIFDPLVLKDLYPKEQNKPKITVRLVDGGVHDNQGIASLLEQDCTVLLVSDASGQMGMQNNPSAGILGVPLRSKDILMARVREAQYQELEARYQSSLLRGFMFLHLKKDLDVKLIDWIDCNDPQDKLAEADNNGSLTSYGIQKDIQKLLASIRTDLDSFCDKEAFALMTSGYRMAEAFSKGIEGLPKPQGKQPNWRFLAIEDLMKGNGSELERNALKRILDVASNEAFKVWRLSPELRFFKYILAIGVLAVLVLACINWWLVALPSLSVGRIVLAILGILIGIAGGLIFGKKVMGIARFRETLVRLAIAIVLAFLGCLVAWIHLLIFDRWYLRIGRINLPDESLTYRSSSPGIEKESKIDLSVAGHGGGIPQKRM